MATNKAYSYKMFELVYEACPVKAFYLTLVNVYVDLLIFTRIAGTS